MGELKIEDQQLLLRSLLRDTFNDRVKRNERYSMRAFARDLEVDSSTLSHVIAGRRPASREFITTVAAAIPLPLALTFKPLEDSDFDFLSAERFEMISEWYHFAILDLTLLKDFKSDITWIAKRLQLDAAVIKRAITNLHALELIEIKDGVIKKTCKQFTNDLGIKTTEAKREYQRQVVKLALKAIDECEPTRKDITSITIAANPAKMELAREKIKEFRRELCALLEDGAGEDVYHLTIQLYPVTMESEK